MPVTVDVPRTLLLNANQITRMHWRVKGERAAALKLLTRARAGISSRPFPTRVACTVDIRWPDKRRRDAHNLMPTIKHCIDGFVAAGWLTDDADKYLQGPDLRTIPDERCDPQYACSLTFHFQEMNP